MSSIFRESVSYFKYLADVSENKSAGGTANPAEKLKLKKYYALENDIIIAIETCLSYKKYERQKNFNSKTPYCNARIKCCSWYYAQHPE